MVRLYFQLIINREQHSTATGPLFHVVRFSDRETLFVCFLDESVCSLFCVVPVSVGTDNNESLSLLVCC